MKSPNPLIVDFKQKGASEQILHRPLLTSHHSNWSGIHLEHHRGIHDTPEHYMTSHIIAVCMNSVQTGNWLDDRFQRNYTFRGSIGIYPANILHKAVVEDVAEFLVLAFDPAFLNNVAQEGVDPDRIELIPHFPIQQDRLILEMGLALKAELESGCLGGRLYGDSIATTLAVHLLRKYSVFAPPIPTPTNGLPKYKLKQAIEYINEHLGENVSLEALASQLDMSQYHFCRLFKQSMGIAPHKYLMQQRIEQAKVLLKQKGVTISDIAAQVGFVDQSHFTKYFRQLTGITPKAYREQ